MNPLKLISEIPSFFQQQGSSQDVVNILKEEDGQLMLDLEALKNVLMQESVADLPVAIYSIAGTYQTGKSLLLNLFVRYTDTGELLFDTQDDIISGPFPCRRSLLTGCTKGIVVQKEPITVATKTHPKVAVFLMDTQGLFDQSTSSEAASLIMDISLLLSSCHFFNLKSNIEHWHIDKINVFMFLIRDWKNEAYSYGFTGGKNNQAGQRNYLEDILEYEMSSEEHRNSARRLRKTFSALYCFLFPSPVEAVKKMAEKDVIITLNDIDKLFKQHASEFFEYLCDEENIVLKKIGNKEVTCRQLYNYAVRIPFTSVKNSH
ncbi:atlastin-2-like isoform X2 [Clavelina lepadiformis]|uniref:atlastin-2-like isoform X2 n=1 Tax=Clavelina lepadiformis TaxID=159417 RepID=UPI00404220A2